MTVWRFVRYWLYIVHRWLGVFACLLFVGWFASGLVMSYVGYPEAQPARRYQAGGGDMQVLLSVNGLALLVLGILPQQLIGLCAIALTQSNFP